MVRKPADSTELLRKKAAGIALSAIEKFNFIQLFSHSIHVMCYCESPAPIEEKAIIHFLIEQD